MFIALISLSNCSDPDLEIKRKVVSISNYSRKPKNEIMLGVILDEQNIFKGKLEVSINHNKSASDWSNLVFGITLDDSLYFATAEDYRFTKEDKISAETSSPIKFYIELSELDYTSPFPDRKVTSKEIASRFKTVQKFTIAATLNDPALLSNPLLSSSLLHSGPVEIEFR